VTLAVLYLWRGQDGGLDAGTLFLDSYRALAAGCAHELIVLLKGWHRIPGVDQARRRARAQAARVIELPDDGYDFGAYFRAARQVDHSLVCFLNTHSRITAERWLANLRDAAEQHNVGAAGATGSWGTLTPRARGPGVTLPGLAAWPLRFAAHIGRFPSFPNPHLRSNALLLPRERFLAFADAAAAPARKNGAHFLESGRGSLSAFLRVRGLRPVVVGADAKVFDAADWMASGTFRVPGQPNLMITDNQTRNYALADRRMRRILEFAAWGETLTP
jgi:hypothetical protein